MACIIDSASLVAPRPCPPRHGGGAPPPPGAPSAAQVSGRPHPPRAAAAAAAAAASPCRRVSENKHSTNRDGSMIYFRVNADIYALRRSRRFNVGRAIVLNDSLATTPSPSAAAVGAASHMITSPPAPSPSSSSSSSSASGSRSLAGRRSSGTWNCFERRSVAAAQGLQMHQFPVQISFSRGRVR